MQYLQGTWAHHSTVIYGSVLEKTPAREWYVATAMIEKWLSEGYDEGDISRIWNQGNAGPCVRGINKHNVPYDSCKYEQSVLSIYRQKVLAIR